MRRSTFVASKCPNWRRSTTPAARSRWLSPARSMRRGRAGSLLLDPGGELGRDLVRIHVLDDTRLALLLRQRDALILDRGAVELRGLGTLQRGHDRSHVLHAGLRVVARLSEISGGPSDDRG